jgi:hypothetical protein
MTKTSKTYRILQMTNGHGYTKGTLVDQTVDADAARDLANRLRKDLPRGSSDWYEVR